MSDIIDNKRSFNLQLKNSDNRRVELFLITTFSFAPPRLQRGVHGLALLTQKNNSADSL